jgi:hypothetical protein
MTHALVTALGAIAVAGTMTLSAQTPTPPTPRPQTPAPSPSTASRTDDKTMTLTGCLKPGSGAADSGRTTAGTPSGAASSAATTFILTDVESDAMGSSTTPSPTGTTPGTSPTPSTTGTTPGTAGTAGAGMSHASAGKQYTLAADAGVNLSAHLNHKVRVTGKLSEMPAASGSTARPGETSPTADRKAMDNGKTLTVSSVTMISSSCSTTR